MKGVKTTSGLLLMTLIFILVSVGNVSTKSTVSSSVTDDDGLIHPNNGTLYELINETETELNEGSSDPGEPPFWCPHSYALSQTPTGEWFQLCRPESCVEVPYKENYTEYIIPDEYMIPSINFTTSMARLCTSQLSETFLTCSKFHLEKSKYEILDNGSLWNIPNGYNIPLGHFFIDVNGTAAMCDLTNDNSSNAVKSPPWCLPFSFTENEFRFGPNQTIEIPKLNALVRSDYFSLSPNHSIVNACIPVDPEFQNCEHMMILSSNDYNKHDNFDFHSKTDDHSYSFRSYFLTADGLNFVTCIMAVPPVRKETRYLYASATIISAFCLFLALITHIFFPSLNYHTKGLLCLAFSLMMMYIAMTVRYFTSDLNSPAEYMVVFAMQYIFALSAFFWLSALSYDLWRVFSKMTGTITPGQDRKKKRAFIAKCLFAYGTPVIMCSITIAIQYSKSAQHSLKVILQLDQTAWFMDPRTIFLFFYGPILILLIANLVFFILTIISIRRASSGIDLVNKKVSKKLLRVYVKIFLVMGITWFAEIITWAADRYADEAYWYVPDLINCLQGVFLFIIYVCKKKTLTAFKVKFGYMNSSQITQSTSSEEKSRKTSMITMQRISQSPAP